jgi:arabinose-5-phosphate isomerase
MTANPIIITANAPLVEALAIMENRNNQISVLPVVENNVLIGLIRIHDIIGKG